ncbi:MAG: hypothetical protein JRF02_05270 [Deltaproteobacteria bacterium]|jgi:hypothetical protein|nr:hypothetical protein [Deltaproteobacteria bacterium]
MAFCLDEQKSHIVDQSLYLVDCHSSNEADRSISEKHFSIIAEKRKSDCTDVSLTNANILNRPKRRKLSTSVKVVLSFTLPNEIVCYQQQVTENRLTTRSQPLFILPHINMHRTVVLLI